MEHTIRKLTEALAVAPDYWAKTRKALPADESLDGMLPAFRRLPACALADELLGKADGVDRLILAIVAGETVDSHVFRNGVFVLMYSDSLFIYKGLKDIYLNASPAQRKWVDPACRKMMLRCLEVPEDSQAELTREVVRNTHQGRLATTGIV
jgi:hypothetical protein